MTANRFLVGDATTRLRDVPTASIDTVITSPPYFLLRDYGVRGQLGAERTVDDWADHLTGVCREVARVLKPTGSLWLNLGDAYSRHCRYGAPPKSLLLAPERVLLRLLADGWTVRNKVVWQKTTHRPSSARDRLTCSWEPLYLLVRSRHYFFDLDPIRRAFRSPQRSRQRRVPPQPERGALANPNTGLQRMGRLGIGGHPLGPNPGDVVATAPSNYRGAHFATFPPALVETLLKATCPEKVCSACGRPWQRAPVQRQLGELAVLGKLRPRCDCQAETKPGLVLDPFSGAGTVAVVAHRQGRHWLGIDINPKYVRLAEQRLRDERRQAA
ncbi:MAG TPA: site-specific DNA-methyltransferase [Frankiaceae bacterium]|nr:site-specific DNA-methyltransferase [Frankiaceae bacterium]